MARRWAWRGDGRGMVGVAVGPSVVGVELSLSGKVLYLLMFSGP